MLSFVRWFVRVCFLAMLILLPACASSCSCESADEVPPIRGLLPCKARGKSVSIAPPSSNRVIVPGSIPQSFGVDAIGNAVASLSLTVAPSRGPQPDLTLHYNSANDHDAGIGVGFSLRAGSAVTRCPKEIALDGEIRAVKYDDEDLASLCFDGKRMVVIAQNGNTTEYRLFPDEQIKVIGHFDSASASHFEAFFPDGRRVRYGVTDATRPMAQTGVPRAWLVEEQSDPRMWIPSAARNSVAARPRMIPLDTRVPSPIACFPVLAVRSPWLEAT